MTARERVARVWHEGSDHAADGAPFGGPLCNCWQVADRIMPMLRDAWDRGHGAPCDQWVVGEMCREYHPNPYESEEDR